VLARSASRRGAKPIAATMSRGRDAERAPSLSERGYAVLRRRILTCDLEPGALIDEKAIAAELRMSRTPVREALKRLADEGLVEVRAQAHTLVKPIDRKRIYEAYLIRRALEMESVAQAARRSTLQSRHQLQDIHMLHKRALQRRRYVDAIDLDDRFHRTLSEISDLPHLWQTIDVSKAHLDRLRYLTVPRIGQGEATLIQHQAIIKAVAKGDDDAARKAMADHLDKAYAGIVAFLDSLPEQPATED
jgi:GntR family transcriptional regulator, rspAB operon transcriptional repressor